jgi:hypothetical protein
VTQRHVILIAAIAASLSACSSAGGPSLSGSAEESAKSESGQSSLWERTRSLLFESGKTTEMAANGIIADAFIEDARSRGADAGRFTAFALMPVDGKRLPLDQAVGDAIPSAKAEIAALPTKVGAQPMMSPEHMVADMPILIALNPRSGWEVPAMDDRKVDPAFDTPFFRRNRPKSNYDPDLHRRYMEALAISAIFANEVFAQIASQLDGVRLADPQAARQRVIQLYQEIPGGKLLTRLAEIRRDIEAGGFTTDLTGSRNIHFTHRLGDFVGDARGMTWTKSGGIWFGDGKIDGQAINFRLASTTSLGQREAQSGSAATSSDARVSGSGSLGPSR